MRSDSFKILDCDGCVTKEHGGGVVVSGAARSSADGYVGTHAEEGEGAVHPPSGVQSLEMVPPSSLRWRGIRRWLRSACGSLVRRSAPAGLSPGQSPPAALLGEACGWWVDEQGSGGDSWVRPSISCG
jgi:hypothetical protein